MPSDADFQAAIRANPDDSTIRYAYADWLEEQGQLVRAANYRFNAARAACLNVAGHYGQGVWRASWKWDALGFVPTVERGDLSEPILPKSRRTDRFFPPWQVTPKPLVWKKWLLLAGMKECSPTRKNMIACRDALHERGEHKQAGRLTVGLVTKKQKDDIHEEGRRLLTVQNEMREKYENILHEIEGIPPGYYIGLSCPIFIGFPRRLAEKEAKKRGLHTSQMKRKPSEG